MQAAERGVDVTSPITVSETVSCLVWGDEARLHQILANLLSTLNFTPSGGSVTVQLRKTGTKAITAVKTPAAY
jgi:signal transduction histidine kinase